MTKRKDKFESIESFVIENEINFGNSLVLAVDGTLRFGLVGGSDPCLNALIAFLLM